MISTSKSILLVSVVVTSFLLVLAQQPPNPTPKPTPAPTPVPPQVICNVTNVKPATRVQNIPLGNCIVTQFAVYVTVGENQYVDLGEGKLNEELSHCHNVSATSPNPVITIDYPCGQINLNFNHSPTDGKTYVSALLGKYIVLNTTHLFSNTSQLFATTQTGHYYKCNAEQTIKLNETNSALHFSNVALEAYKVAPGTSFYSIPEECLQDSQPVSDLIRIGVGISLIALVAIVLVAYFIGRRRWSERSSYESV